MSNSNEIPIGDALQKLIELLNVHHRELNFESIKTIAKTAAYNELGRKADENLIEVKAKQNLRVLIQAVGNRYKAKPLETSR